MTNYNKKRLKAAKDAEIRQEELYERAPNFENIDKQIKLLSIKLSKLILSNYENMNEEVIKLRENIEHFKSEKRKC